MPPLIKCIDGPCEGREFFWDMNPLGRGLRQLPYEKRFVADGNRVHVYSVTYSGAEFSRTEILRTEKGGA